MSQCLTLGSEGDAATLAGWPSFLAEAGIHKADGARCASIVIADLIRNPEGTRRSVILA